MKKIKVGVLGAGRGRQMIRYCHDASHAEVVAICDNHAPTLERQKLLYPNENVTYYDNFDEFINHDMDAVILANCAHQHAPFAIKCLKAGKHVLSEVLPVQALSEAVELVEAVEETGLIYAYGENFCYMPATYEMKRLYEEGKIGVLEYAECEYIHNCETITPIITYGDKNHWRNSILYANFYCTHSLGPIIHSTGLRPVSVTGFEGQVSERAYRTGKKSGNFGIEMVTMENGAICKSIHGGLYKDSHWYCMYGTKGRMESLREDSCESDEHMGGCRTILVNADSFSGEYGKRDVKRYNPIKHDHETAKDYVHVGGDFYMMYHFIEKLLGNPEADIIDVYEALDMGLCGIMAYRSVLDGGIPKEIPNFRNREERDKWRNDTTCSDPNVAGDKIIPIYSKGEIKIDDSVYEHIRELWLEDQKKDIAKIKKQMDEAGR